MYLVLTLFLITEFIKEVSNPRKSREELKRRLQKQLVSSLKTQEVEIAMPTETPIMKMKLDLEDHIRRMGYTVYTHYLEYIRAYGQPENVYNLELLQTIAEHWSQITTLYEDNPSQRQRKSLKFQIEMIKEKSRYENHLLTLKEEVFEDPASRLYKAVQASALERYEQINIFKNKYGISEELDERLKSFLRDSTVEEYTRDILLGITEKINLDLSVPDKTRVEKLYRILRKKIPEYVKDDKNIEFGFPRLWNEMIKVAIRRVQVPNLVQYYIDAVYCGAAIFNEKQQYECHRFIDAFHYLTLTQIESLVRMV